jgi:hypothetical protein
LPLKIAIGVGFHAVRCIEQMLVTIALRQGAEMIGLVETVF